MMNHVDIDQKKLYEISPELDFNDGAILSFFVRFSSSPAIKSKVENGKIYYWFSHSKIMEDLPCLNIKTVHGIKKRLEKLIKSGLLIRHPDNEKQKKSFYGFGDAYDFYTFEKTVTKKAVNERLKTTETVTARGNNGNQSYEDSSNQSYRDRELLNRKLETERGGSAKKAEPAPTLFPEMEDEKARKTLFRNSKVNDFNFFKNRFAGPEFEQVDLNYYFQSVSDWSDKKNQKSTVMGWLATARTWMRRDNVDGKLMKLKSLEEREQADQDYLEYMKLDNDEYQ
jgi:hypothetical protein